MNAGGSYTYQKRFLSVQRSISSGNCSNREESARANFIHRDEEKKICNKKNYPIF